MLRGPGSCALQGFQRLRVLARLELHLRLGQVHGDACVCAGTDGTTEGGARRPLVLETMARPCDQQVVDQRRLAVPRTAFELLASLGPVALEIAHHALVREPCRLTNAALAGPAEHARGTRQQPVKKAQQGVQGENEHRDDHDTYPEARLDRVAAVSDEQVAGLALDQRENPYAGDEREQGKDEEHPHGVSFRRRRGAPA